MHLTQGDTTDDANSEETTDTTGDEGSSSESEEEGSSSEVPSLTPRQTTELNFYYFNRGFQAE